MILSLPKLIGLCLILWIVWRVFRAIDARKASLADKKSQTNTDKSNQDKANRSSIDLEECTICKAWVSRENCGRDDCPYRL